MIYFWIFLYALGAFYALQDGLWAFIGWTMLYWILFILINEDNNGEPSGV
jgi:hypothetical protein